MDRIALLKKTSVELLFTPSLRSIILNRRENSCLHGGSTISPAISFEQHLQWDCSFGKSPC